MMRESTFYVDVDTGGLLDPITWRPRSTIPRMFRGDVASISLHLMKLKTADPLAYEAATLPVGSWIAGVKHSKEPGAAGFLASSEDITDAGAGVLSMTIALTSPDLAGRFLGNARSMLALFELEVVTVDERETVAQFLIEIVQDVIKGTEGAPAPADPTYYTAAQVNALLGAPRDLLSLRDAATGETVTIRVNDGELEIVTIA